MTEAPDDDCDIVRETFRLMAADRWISQEAMLVAKIAHFAMKLTTSDAEQYQQQRQALVGSGDKLRCVLYFDVDTMIRTPVSEAVVFIVLVTANDQVTIHSLQTTDDGYQLGECIKDEINEDYLVHAAGSLEPPWPVLIPAIVIAEDNDYLILRHRKFVRSLRRRAKLCDAAATSNVQT